MSENNSHIPVVILAGGRGTNIGTTEMIPKPMVEVNGIPLIQNVIDDFAKYGFVNFIVAAGFGEQMISDYFEQSKQKNKIHIKVINTGVDTSTGARIALLKEQLHQYDQFIVTYGDIISDINIDKLLQFHLEHKKLATVTAVHYPTRFRIMGIHPTNDLVKGFANKPLLQKEFVIGGFFVFNKELFEQTKINSSVNCNLELDVLEELANKGELLAFKFDGFWQPIDSERDRMVLLNHLNESVKKG